MKYEEFLSKVRKRARFASNEEAENATQATLVTFAERLTSNEAEQLAAQLPPELAVYMKALDTVTGESFTLDEFFRRVGLREGVEPVDADYHARVVLALIAESVSMGEIEDVRAQLPQDFAKLLDVENEGEIPELGTVAVEEDENA